MDGSSRENIVTIRTRKVVDIVHPGQASVPVYVVKEKIAEMYKTDVDHVVGYGFRQHFGGGRSTGFALIYDSMDHVKKFEPKYRLDKNGIADHFKIRRSRRKVYKWRKIRSFGTPMVGERKAEKPLPQHEGTSHPHAHQSRRPQIEQ